MKNETAVDAIEVSIDNEKENRDAPHNAPQSMERTGLKIRIAKNKGNSVIQLSQVYSDDETARVMQSALPMIARMTDATSACLEPTWASLFVRCMVTSESLTGLRHTETIIVMITKTGSLF